MTESNTDVRGNHPDVDIYLHCGRDETLWSLVRPGGIPKPLDTITGFIGSLPPGGVRTARIVDIHPNNTGLSLELYKLQGRGLIDRVCVCSPTCLPEACRTGPAEDLLWQAACWMPLKPRMGGWHEFTEIDRLTRELAIADDSELEKLFDRHPLSAPLGFLSTLGRSACARLIGLVRDPRWYYDPRKPNTCNKLISFLGLNPQDRRPRHDRHRLVLRAWQGNGLPEDWDSDPGGYFWRVWDRAGRGEQGEIKASQRFVRLLYHLWLEVLRLDGHDVFPPGELFSDPLIASAFNEYCELLQPPFAVRSA